MRFLGDGRAVLAGGGVAATLTDGTRLAEETGCAVAVDAGRVLFVQESPWGVRGAPSSLLELDLGTRAVVRHDAGLGLTAGGGGEWLAGDGQRLRWSLPFAPPAGRVAPGDVDRTTGLVAVKQLVRRADGAEAHDVLLFHRTRGQIWRLEVAVGAIEWMRFHDGRLVFVDGINATHAYDVTLFGVTAVDPPATLLRTAQAMPLRVLGAWWVAYPTYDTLRQALVAHPWDSAATGVYVLAAPPRNHNWDVEVVGAGLIQFGWSVGANELPGEGRIDAHAAAAPVPLAPALALPEPPVVVPAFPSFERFVRIVTMDRPGARFIFAGIGGAHTDPRVRGVLHTIGGNLRHELAAARDLRQPLYVYKDAPHMRAEDLDRVAAAARAIDPHGLDGLEVVALAQGYVVLGESTADGTARIRASLGSLRARVSRVGLMEGTYCQVRDDGTYNWRLADVIARLEANHPLVNEYGLSDLVLYSWDRTAPDDPRKDGARYFPALVVCTDRIVAASVGAEIAPPPADDEPDDTDHPPDHPPAEDEDPMPKKYTTEEKALIVKTAADLAAEILSIPPARYQDDAWQPCWGMFERIEGALVAKAAAEQRPTVLEVVWGVIVGDHVDAHALDAITTRAIDAQVSLRR